MQGCESHLCLHNQEDRENGGTPARDMLMDFIKYEQDSHWRFVQSEEDLRSEDDEPESPPVSCKVRSNVVVKVTEPNV